MGLSRIEGKIKRLEEASKTDNKDFLNAISRRDDLTKIDLRVLTFLLGNISKIQGRKSLEKALDVSRQYIHRSVKSLKEKNLLIERNGDLEINFTGDKENDF